MAKAKKLGAELSSGYLSMLERGDVSKPSPRILFALASIYGEDYIKLMKMAGYIPENINLEPHTPAQIAFKGASQLTEEQRNRVQYIIDLEIRGSLRSKKKSKE
jgi:transcriptional regulator with XRE-family HTH domain